MPELIDSSPRIIADQQESMPEFLARIREVEGETATVVIPANTGLLVTASEFRALKASADQIPLRLIVETDDRLRKQLAAMFGLPVVDLIPDAASAGSAPAASNGTAIIDDDSDAPISRPKKATLTPSRTAEELAKASAPQIDEEEAELAAAARRPPVTRRGLLISAAVVASVAVLALLLSFLFRSATVTLTMAQAPVSSQVTFAVAGPGSAPPPGGAFTVEAAPIAYEAPFSASIPATGIEREQLTAATGSVQLRNPSDEPATIPAGTSFTTYDGVQYSFSSDVTVPEAAESGPGQANGSVVAINGGEAANRTPGTLSGKLDNGVYFMNRNGEIAGGTDNTRTVVAQADLDALIARATERLPEIAQAMVTADERGVIPGSVQVGEISYTLDRQVGEEAESVSIQATAPVRALGYPIAEARQQAYTQLQTGLAQNVPPGYVLDELSVAFVNPVAIEGKSGAALFHLDATAQARVTLSGDQPEDIARAIAGMSVQEAEAYLRTLPNVTSFKISTSPGFLPERLPGRTSRIEIDQG